VAEIVKEFSFSDYAIDDNLSRHTWKTKITSSDAKIAWFNLTP